MQLSQLLSVVHNLGYVGDGFQGKMANRFQLPPELHQGIQLLLLLFQRLPHSRLLLLQEQGDHAARVLLGKELGNGIDGQPQLPQETDQLQPFQVFLRVQPSAALAELTGHQYVPGIVVLHRPHSHPAELRHLSRGVFRHSPHLLTPATIQHDAAS